jgi:hypothetical protein
MRTLIAAAAVAATVVLGSAAGGASGATTCKNLKLTTGLRSALQQAHGRAAIDGPIAKGSIYYGRCGSTHYAIATFSKALADQPEKFRKLAGRRWVDKGDGFENGCDASARRPIPKALVKLWGVCRSF